LEHTHDYLDHNELGLALETIADSMSNRTAPVSADERERILEFRGRMTRANLEYALRRDINPDIRIEPSERLTSLNTAK